MGIGTIISQGFYDVGEKRNNRGDPPGTSLFIQTHLIVSRELKYFL
jgi:hypothetical protein